MNHEYKRKRGDSFNILKNVLLIARWIDQVQLILSRSPFCVLFETLVDSWILLRF